MSKNYPCVLHVSKEAYEEFMSCREIIYRIDPSLKGLHLNQDYVLRRITNYYKTPNIIEDD